MFPLTEQEKAETQKDLEATVESLIQSAKLLSNLIQSLNDRLIILDRESEAKLRMPLTSIGSQGFKLNLSQFRARKAGNRVFSISEKDTEES